MKSLFLILAAVIGPVSVSAQDYDYKCFSYYWNGDNREKGTMTLSLNSRTATADIIEESWDKNLGGTLNEKYKSKGKIKFIKYGTNLIVEEALVSGGRALRDGSLGGFGRVEGQAEGGFYQYKFICKREE